MRGEHAHSFQVAGTPAELEGERLQLGGGNIGQDILGGYTMGVGTASTSFAPSGAMDSRNGRGVSGVSQLSRIILHIAAFWVLSILVLIGLHKLGFRFSLTVG